VEFCRAQVAHHLAVAEATCLPNVRDVALSAARSWQREAQCVERLKALRLKNATRDGS
jgi:hypothetical protein